MYSWHIIVHCHVGAEGNTEVVYPAIEGITKMVAPGGVTLSGHFIPGGTNIMASRMQLTDTFLL